jgi:NAD(P)-dependent dehydrogenase (short-subunit alcohol dehydrogenase family)
MSTDPAGLARPRAGEQERGRDLRGTVAVISGGGRGVGRLLAIELAGAGAATGLIARSAAELAAVTAEIERAAGTAAAMACDVSDEQAPAAAVTELGRRLGPANLLINNAGIPGPAGPLWEISLAEWWRAFEVNVGGAVTLTRLLPPGMIAARAGRIINITSYAGVYRWPLMSAYATSKAALVKLTETLAEETRPHGVAVFSVDPGLLPIGLSEPALSSRATPQTPQGRVHGWIRDQLRSGHGADPAQAARLVLALASGCCDRLSGRHLTATDDFRTLLAELDRIERDDLHTLRLRTMTPGGIPAETGRRRPGAGAR